MLVCCIFRPLFFLVVNNRGVGVEMAKMLSVVDSRHVVGVLFGFGLVSENDCGFLSYLRFCHSGFFGVFPMRQKLYFWRFLLLD